MQIQISEKLFKRLRRLADRRQQPVEQVVADRLFTALDDELDALPSVEEAELRALHHLSDDALRAIVAEKMSVDNQALMAKLMARHSKGLLTDDEKFKLESLVERSDQLMLRKAEAAAILVHRGYSESITDLMRSDD